MNRILTKDTCPWWKSDSGECHHSKGPIYCGNNGKYEPCGHCPFNDKELCIECKGSGGHLEGSNRGETCTWCNGLGYKDLDYRKQNKVAMNITAEKQQIIIENTDEDKNEYSSKSNGNHGNVFIPLSYEELKALNEGKCIATNDDEYSIFIYVDNNNKQSETFNSGDKSKAICESCKSIVPTTFFYRNYILPDVNITIPNILQGYCDRCGEVVSLPHQSTYQIKETIESLKLKA
jgi:uncharacterized OB-fold protein